MTGHDVKHDALVRVALALVTLSALGGCSSSMQVEVEVYKGPLSQTIANQRGELMGVIQEAQTSLGFFGGGLLKTVADCNSNAVAPSDPVSEGLRTFVASSNVCPKESVGLARSAIELLTLTDTVIRTQYATPDPATGTIPIGGIAPAGNRLLANQTAWYPEGGIGQASTIGLEQLATDASELAARFKAKAFLSAYSELGEIPDSEELRRLISDFATIAAEYGNQIGSRAAVLWKQIRDGTDPTKLALSDYLRDSGNTDFLNLYDWLDSTDDQRDRPQPRGGLSLANEDRVRLAKRLFADHYWHKINEVHANGQGDVHMAFIRDQLGNWNLKAFDQDTEQLVDTYRGLTEAGIKLAIEAAEAAASGGGSQALAVAGQLIEGRVGGETLVANTAQIDALRRRVVQDLENAKAAIEGAPEFTAAKQAAEEAAAKQTALRDAQSRFDAAKMALEAKELELGLPDKRTRLAELKAERDALQAQVATLDQRIAEAQAAGTPTTDLEAERGRVSTDLSAKNTEVQNLDAEIKTAEAQVDADLKNAFTTAETQLGAARAEATAAEGALAAKREALKPIVATQTMRAAQALSAHLQVVDALKGAQVAAAQPAPATSPAPTPSAAVTSGSGAVIGRVVSSVGGGSP